MARVEYSPDAIFKLVIVGDSGVGKSCFLLQFTDGQFRDDHTATIGVEYGAKNLEVNSKTVKLQIWDTAGQESFKAITRSFYRRAQAVILMYDITELSSFNRLPEWINEIYQNADKDILIFLVGNMADLEEHREVNRDLPIELMKQFQLAGFLEVSAKTAQNVTEVFVKVAESLFSKINLGEKITNGHLVLNDKPKKKGKKCCGK